MPPKGRPRPKCWCSSKSPLSGSTLRVVLALDYPGSPRLSITVLSEAAALGMMNEAYDAVRVIRTFEPLEVMPHLTRFMRGACGRGQAAWEVFLTHTSI